MIPLTEGSLDVSITSIKLNNIIVLNCMFTHCKY